MTENRESKETKFKGNFKYYLIFFLIKYKFELIFDKYDAQYL